MTKEKLNKLSDKIVNKNDIEINFDSAFKELNDIINTLHTKDIYKLGRYRCSNNQNKRVTSKRMCLNNLMT